MRYSFRHIKRVAHGIPEDRVSCEDFLESNDFPLIMSWTAVGLFTRGNLASDEAWCRYRGALYPICALVRVSTSGVYLRW